MKLGSLRVFAAAVALAAPACRVDAQRHDQGLLTLLQREFEKSTQLLEHFWGEAFGEGNAQEEQDTVVMLTVVEEDDNVPLTDDEKALACRVAVQRIDEQAAIAREAQRMASRLRAPLGGLVTFQFEGETRCEDLEAPALVRECVRVAAMEDEIAQFLQEGMAPQEICEAVGMADEMMQDEPMGTAQDPSLSCKLCKRFVKMVDDAIQQDMAQVQQVREILGDLCDSMSADSMCHTFLKRYDDVVQWLVHGTDPDVVCERLTMCMPTDPVLTADRVVAPVGGVDHACFYCEHIQGAVAFVIQHAPEQLEELHTVIKFVCKLAPKDCKCDVFSANFGKIVDWTKQGKTPEEICTAIGMCKKETDEDAPKMVATRHDAEPAEDVDHACFYCEHITGAVAFVIQHAPDQLPILRKAIKVVCKLAPKDCKCADVSTNFDKIVDWTKQGKTPEQICTAIGMCKKGERDAAVKLLGSVTSPKFLETISSLVGQNGGDDKKCFYCEYFTTLLEIAIQEDEQDMDQIRQYADLICGILGDNKYCHQYVEKLDTAIDDIKKGEKPREICTDMQFCTKKVKATQLSSPIVGDNKQCFYCDYFVTLLEVAIQEDDADIEQIRQYADLVCGMLGDDSICHQYVDKLDAAVDAIKQGKKPHEICAEFKFCTKSQKLALPPPTVVDGDQKCFYCDYFVTILEVVIQEDKADIDQVREFADMICGMLGDDNVCHEYVSKLDVAIDGLKKGKKPREICVDLKFCTKNVKAAVRAVSDDKKCLYCDYFVTILEVFIVQDDTDINLVRQYADMICGMLGDDNVCHQYVNKFDVIVDELKQGKKTHDICRDIKFCTTAQHLVLPSPVLDRKDNKTCFYCDYFATILEVALQEDPNDVDAVRLYANIICGMLGETNVCHQYLNQFEYAIDAFKKGKKPRDVCTEFKYCSGKQVGFNGPAILDTPSLLQHAMVKSVSSAPVGAIDECFFCTQVSNVLKVAIAQNPSKVTEIRTVADLVCKTMPATNKCHAVMHEIDQIIDSIKKGEEPAAICRDMQFCKKALASIPVAKTTPRVTDSTCAYCDGIATVLEYALKSQPNQVQQLREAAGLVCDFMPEDDKCHDDLKMFDKAVVDLKAGKSPHTVCVEFNLCKATTATSSGPKLMSSSIAKLNMLDAKTLAAKSAESGKSMSMGCLLCEYTAEGLVLIKGDTTELHLAKQALETMCFILPPNARCDVLSSKFDDLVELVGQGKSPSQACNAVSLCDAAFVEPVSSTEPKQIGDIVAEQ